MPGRAWSALGTEYAKTWGPSPRLHFCSPSLSEQGNDEGNLAVPNGGQAWGRPSSAPEESLKLGLILC